MTFKELRLFLLLVLFLFSAGFSQASVVSRLSGRILLQIESIGEAWYVNPVDGKRYLITQSEDAVDLIKNFGLGVSGDDFDSWQEKAPSYLAGRIIVNLGDNNQAYYVHPYSLKPYSLGKDKDAFTAIRSFGLGVSDRNLYKIEIGSNQTNLSYEGEQPVADAKNSSYFSWQYKDKRYQINFNLSDKLYQEYQNTTHFYKVVGPLPDNWREDFYAMLLKPKPKDDAITFLVSQLKKQAKANNLSDDELVELSMAFVQAIIYDDARASNTDTQVNYPYETLYRRLGICSDKAVLATSLLRSLGYGSAVLIFPDKDHAAVGVECPKGYTVFDTDYCYVETTGFFPIGFVPQSFSSSGVAVKQEDKIDENQFDKLFDTSNLGSLGIYQQTHGKVYQGIVKTYEKINKLKSLEGFLGINKPTIDSYKAIADAKLLEVEAMSARLRNYKNANNYQEYNQLIPQYNQLVASYNDSVNNYKLKIEGYNDSIAVYEQTMKDLYVAGK